MAKLGATDKQIAGALGISTSTLHQWRVTHAEFSECLKMAKEVVDAAVERALIQRALGYDYETDELLMGKKIVVRKHALPDVRAQQFWLRNRMPDIYRERKETEHKHTLAASFDRMLDIIDEKIQHARVAWTAVGEPWVVEKRLLSRVPLPLNLQGNNHPFVLTLKSIRSAAKQAA